MHLALEQQPPSSSQDCISSPTSGQGIELQRHWTLAELEAVACADVWGYETASHRYAITGCRGGGARTIKFIRLDEPGVVASLSVAQSWWYDFRTHGQYAFAVSETTVGDFELPLMILVKSTMMWLRK
jgi:hypothetical protein